MDIKDLQKFKNTKVGKASGPDLIDKQMYINIFTGYVIRNQHDILKTAVADVNKGELQTLTKLTMRHQVCPSETCCTIISESTITMIISRGRRNCGVTYYVSIYY